MPSPVFPGGVLMGESARLVDTFKIKGAHLAMYSGLLAANSIVNVYQRRGKVQTIGIGIQSRSTSREIEQL